MMFINLRRGVEIDCPFCERRHAIETECPELTTYLADLLAKEEPRGQAADPTT